MGIADRLEEVLDCLQYRRRSVWRKSRKEGVEDNSTWLIEDDLRLAAEAIEPLRSTLCSPLQSSPSQSFDVLRAHITR